MEYSFFALISRLKYITRWSLMRNSGTENVQEHSHTVAVIAHALAAISRDVYGADVDPGAAALAALYHDASEIYTGDMPTPVKYFSRDITAAYKSVEAVAADKLLRTLPDALKPEYAYLLGGGDTRVAPLVKAADKLAAYIKCLEELRVGNLEFRRAAEQTLAKLNAMELPEVTYFIENFIPAFELTLDELTL
jgi:5'-deoxynucleotidase